jgi:hypothetical protein
MITATPSKATMISLGLTPRFLAVSISWAVISREAAAMSQDLLISDAIPTPDPPPVTATNMPGLSFMNSSLSF